MELSRTEPDEKVETEIKNRLLLSWIGLLLGLMAIWLPIANAYHLVATQDPLWLDERHTGWVVNGSWGDVWGRAAAGNQTPLYFFLLKAIAWASGDHAGGLRFVSLAAWVVSGNLLSVVLFIKTRSPIVGIAASMLFASAPWALFYATEARPYALLILVGLSQLLVFVRRFIICFEFDQGPDSRSQRDFRADVGFVLLSVMLVGIHPTGGLLLIAELGVGALIYLFYAVRFMIPIASPVLLANPWRQVVIVAVATIFAGTWLFGLGVAWQRRELWGSFTDPKILAVQLGWVMIGVALVWSWACFDFMKRGTQETPTRMAFFGGTVATAVSLFVILFAMIFDFSMALPLAHQRYTLIGFAGLIVGSAWLIGGITRSWGRAVALALLMVLNVGGSLEQHWMRDFCMNFRINQVRFEDWETSIDLIKKDTVNQPKTVLLLANILEDALLQPRDANRGSQNGISLEDYLMFPVRASNEAAADDAIAGLEFIPLSTWGGQRSELILQYCQTTGPTTYLLTRMDEISLLALLEEISVVGTSQGLRISWSRLGPGQSFVQGIKLTCLAGEADKADKLEEHSQD